jgi:hypothetical protein
MDEGFFKKERDWREIRRDIRLANRRRSSRRKLNRSAWKGEGSGKFAFSESALHFSNRLRAEDSHGRD